MLISPHEAAKLLGLSHKTVQRYCQIGVIPAIRVGNAWILEYELIKDWKPLRKKGNPNWIKKEK